jgi:hypothetical protein
MPFLSSEWELENVANYESKNIDETITTWILSPLWRLFAKIVPEDTSPNVLSLASVLCTLHAWFLTFSHLETHRFQVRSHQFSTSPIYYFFKKNST